LSLFRPRFDQARAKFDTILEAEPLHVPAYWEIGRVCEALMFMRAAATWDPVREDPRYLALLKRPKLDF
jgi:hypothetical protein